jgi:hypothetical protein
VYGRDDRLTVRYYSAMETQIWLPIVTFVVGQLSVIGVEWFRSWLAREQRRRDRRDDFQRETLIELQEALYRVVRSLSNSIAEWELLYAGKPAPVWPEAENPRLLGAGAFARNDALTVRVDDPEVRDLVEKFINRHERMFAEPKDAGVEVAKAHLEDLRSIQRKLNRQMGPLIREL